MSSICRIYAGIIGLFRLIIKKDFFREEIVMIVCVWYNFCEKKWHDMHTCNAYMLCESNIDKKNELQFLNLILMLGRLFGIFLSFCYFSAKFTLQIWYFQNNLLSLRP